MNNLQEVLSNTSNAVFLIVISGIFVTAFVLSIKGKAKEFVNYAPTLLTTLGIFGTFFGIFLGLMEFDQNDVEASIPPLLAGLKTAFFTSLAGMLSSLLLKTMTTASWFKPHNTEELVSDVSPEMILATMQAQLEATKELRTSLVGDEDSTLVYQLKLLRDNFNHEMKLIKSQSNQEFNAQKKAFTEFADKLWIKLQDFSDTLSRSATEAVIEALKKVISDFNNNLTEQFGDNFKQLNEAVLKLVQWQEQYKQQLEDMKQQYEHGVQSITATASSVSQISEQTQTIPAAMNDLRDVMTVNQQQIAELQNHLEAFKDIRDRAVEAIPEIRSQIDLIVTEISNSVNRASEHYQELLTDSDQYIRHHAETTQNLLENFTTQTTQAANEFGNQVASVADTVQGQVTAGATALKDGLLEGSVVLKEQLTSGSEAISTQMLQSSEAIKTRMLDGSETMATTLVEKTTVIGERLNDGAEAVSAQMLQSSDEDQDPYA